MIFGNSGSGKSTLARKLSDRAGTIRVDLDEVYWEPDQPGVARAPAVAAQALDQRLAGQAAWIVEGCYEVLAAHLLPRTPLLIWLDPGEAACLSHCRARPWEPHKYPSKQAQDENLAMLLEWVSDHYTRSGEMSYEAHSHLYAGYDGPKHHLRRADLSVDEIEALIEG
ncbi:MAG: shikimate kinase [Pseudomonadota bacterium]